MLIWDNGPCLGLPWDGNDRCQIRRAAPGTAQGTGQFPSATVTLNAINILTRNAAPDLRLACIRYNRDSQQFPSMIQTLIWLRTPRTESARSLESRHREDPYRASGPFGRSIAGRKEIDADLLDELEFALITADIGVNTASEILESIRQRVDRKQVGDAQQIKQLIAEHLLEILEGAERPVPRVTQPPAVVMVVGVNRCGKTTTIGKLANRFKAEDAVCCFAQRTRFARRHRAITGVGGELITDVIRQSAGGDPSEFFSTH